MQTVNRFPTSPAKLAGVLLASFLASCGGSGGGSTVAGAAATTYGVSGSISGLHGVLALSNNGEQLAVSANGPFSASNKLANGANFNVGIATQPIGQHCEVSGGSGTVAGADIKDVHVNCEDNAGVVVLRVVPVIGRFMQGAAVRVTDGASHAYAGLVDAAGAASIVIPTGTPGPFLIEAGKDDDSYFSPQTNATRQVHLGDPYRGDTNSYALRAMAAAIPASHTVAVTPLTEIAMGGVQFLAGPSPVTSQPILDANAIVGAAFGVTDILEPPALISSTDGKLPTNTGADRHALVLAGLIKLGLDFDFWMVYGLREDFWDGHFDGRIYSIVNSMIRPELLTVSPTDGASPSSVATALNTQIAAAAALYANAGVGAPTVNDIVLEGRAFFVDATKKIIDPLVPVAAATPTIHTITAGGTTYTSDNRSSPSITYHGTGCKSEVPSGLPLLITTCQVLGQTYNYHLIENTGNRNAKICWRRRDASAKNVCENEVIAINGGSGSRIEIIGSKAAGVDINLYDDRH
jgi:hypothetical protein